MSDDKNPNLDEIIAQSMRSIIEDGTIQKLIDERLEKCVRDAIDASMSYGRVRDIVKERIEDMLAPAIERVSLDRCNVKLEQIINQIISESTIAERKNILKNFSGLISNPPEDGCITVDALIEAFENTVRANWDSTYNREIDFDGSDPEYVGVNYTVELEVEGKSRYYTGTHEDAKLIFTIIDEEDEDECDKFNRVLRLWRNPSDTRGIHYAAYSDHKWDEHVENGWHISIPDASHLTDIANMDAFDILLAQISLHHIPLKDTLEGQTHYGFVDSLECKPEADWS